EEPGVEVATLFRRVARAVNQETGGRQTPELSLSLLGEFYFNKAETDQQAWRRLRGSGDAKAYEDFIVRFPNSFLVEDARARLEGIVRDRQVRDQAERERQLKEELARLEGERSKTANELARRDKAEGEREKLALDQRKRDEELARLENERRQVAEPLSVLEKEQRARAQQPDTAQPRQEAALPPQGSPEGAAKDAPAKPAAPALSGGKLVAAIQEELKRVGCFAGKIDEKWTGAATSRS